MYDTHLSNAVSWFRCQRFVVHGWSQRRVCQEDTEKHKVDPVHEKMEGKINHSNTMKVTVIAIIRAVVVAAVATAPIPTPGAIAAAAPVLAEAVCVVMTMDRYSLSRMALPTLFEPQQKWHSFVEFSMGTTSEGSKR